MHRIAKGQADVSALHVYYSWNESAFPEGAMRMTFTSNHDKNTWEGTEYEQFGPAREAATVLSFVGEGIPLIYNGQEAGNRKRLAFFERDPIVWTADDPQGALLQQLIALRKRHSALWNAPWGARMIHVPNDRGAQLLSFVRQDARGKVLAAFNFSGSTQQVRLDRALSVGTYEDALAGGVIALAGDTVLEMPAWSYRVLVQSAPP